MRRMFLAFLGCLFMSFFSLNASENIPDEVLDVILEHFEDCIQSFQEGKIYIVPENLSFDGSQIALEIDTTTKIILPSLYSDLDGVYVCYAATTLFWECTYCGRIYSQRPPSRCGNPSHTGNVSFRRYNPAGGHQVDQETLAAQKGPQEALGSCQASVAGMIEDKAYLYPHRLCHSKNQFLLLNDCQQWVPISNVKQDYRGYYLDMAEAECNEGHMGFKKVGKTWYCLEYDCPYFVGKSFSY